MPETSGNSETPAKEQSDSERDYFAGYTRVMWFAKLANQRGWSMSERQLVHEILQRERAARIAQRSTLPVVGQEIRSPAWNHGQADALRDLLRKQRERE